MPGPCSRFTVLSSPFTVPSSQPASQAENRDCEPGTENGEPGTGNRLHKIPPTLIIGFGNPLRRDDGVGAEIARQCIDAGFNAIAAHQLLPEMAEPIARVSRVLFVDCHVGVPPGEIVVTPVIPGPAAGIHDPCSPASLIELARELYGSGPEAWLLGIGPASLEFGEGLSDPVRAVIPVVLRHIVGIFSDPAPR